MKFDRNVFSMSIVFIGEKQETFSVSYHVFQYEVGQTIATR